MAPELVIAGPEATTGASLHRQLVGDGFHVVAAADPAELGAAPPPDLVLLGDPDALDRWRPGAPVIVLGGPETEPVDRIRAFRQGCDDFADPFNYEELVERIRAVLRRTSPGPAVEWLEAGAVAIDLRTRRVTVDGERVQLAQKEFELLRELAREPERVFTKDELLRTVWGYRSAGRTRTLDSHASRLRRKLRALAPEQPLVVNVWGVGYVLLGEG